MRWAGWLLVCTLLVLPSPGSAQSYTSEDFIHQTADGVSLVATKYIPAGDGPFPAILITNGWTDRHDTNDELAWSRHFAEQGYVVYAYTSRGWGDSEGEIGLDGPNEVADARSVVALMATDPNVLLDGPGDPRVAMVGKSYGGGIQFLTAREEPALDAIVPFATWSDLLESLAPDDVLKRIWVSLLLGSGTADGHGVYVVGNGVGPDLEGPDSRLYQWYAEATATNAPTEEMRTEIGGVRSLHPGELRTPTMLVQGWPDTLFPPSQALRTYQMLKDVGVPARLVLADVGHGGFGYRHDDGVNTAVDDWLNTTLRGTAPTLPPYPVLRHRYAQDDLVGEMQWPPSGSRYTVFHLHAAGDDGLQPTVPDADVTTALVAPPMPASCTEVSNFQGQSSEECPYGAPETLAVWSSAPLEAATEVTGTPVLRLDVESTQPTDTMLFAQLVDVDSEGTATPVLYQVTPIRGTYPAVTTVTLAMEAVTHTFEAGHRIALQVATTDFAYAHSRELGAVTVHSGGGMDSFLAVPVVPTDAFGDRVPPTVRMAPASAARPGENFTFTVVATDNLALGAVNVTGDVTPVLVSQEALLGTYRVALPDDEAAAQAVVDSLTATAKDLAGNQASATLAGPVVRPEPSVLPEDGEQVHKKDSPGAGLVGLLGVLGLAVALRRRR